MTPPAITSRCPRASRAFTLTELLIVIGIILLMLVLAIPMLSLLSGSRSIDGAQNQITAMLAIARSGAMSLPLGSAAPGGVTVQPWGDNLTQQVQGVFFYLDPLTNRRMMQLVQDRPDPLAPPPSSWQPPTIPAEKANGAVDVYLDCVPNTQALPLPAGVGIAFTAEVSSPFNAPINDRYIGFNVVNGPSGGAYDKKTGAAVTGIKTYNDPLNTYSPPTGTGTGGVRWGDVILFDSTGKIVSLRWGLRVTTCIQSAQVTAPIYHFTSMGRLLYGVPDKNASDAVDPGAFPDLLPRSLSTCYPYYLTYSDANLRNRPPAVLPLRSALAFVLFDQARYDANNFQLDPTDPGNGESNLTIFGDPSQTWDSPTASTPGPTSYARMNWLDNNTTELVINPLNGTIIKAE